MDVDASSSVEDGNISDYLNSHAFGWRLDELLSDLVGARLCNSSRTLSPPKVALYCYFKSVKVIESIASCQ
ncbi:hypothetical protein GOP47_0023886 [Adiantum capillus-veneris]|uniref:Uncharacterized protein n=1 Tax=Adiantum capillus-veneris TaxID=13818 RepID=A0A9D4U6V9_ADICA|nr:hypothetical protein GOP47_0023886 [Adiantum capillus-veneris]